MACYLINRPLHASLDLKVSDDIWTRHPIDLDNLRIFWCPTYVHISSEDRPKLDLKSKKCVFSDYAKDVKGFKLCDLIKKKMVMIKDVVF